jgi:hypothetical protein
MNQADQRAVILAVFDFAADCMADRTEIADELLRTANAPLEIELIALRRSVEQAHAEVQRLNEELARRPPLGMPSPEQLPSAGGNLLLRMPHDIPADVAIATAESLANKTGCYVVVAPVEFTVTSFSTSLTQSELTHLRQTQMVDDLPDQFINSMFADLLLCRLRDILGEAALPPIPDELLQIGELLRTQDNRLTDQPMFLVEELVHDAITDDYSDGFEWRDNSTGMLDCVSELRAKRLELLYHRGRDYKSHYIRIATRKRWQFVTACLTEQGCKDCLARDGHNLGETRIYAEGSYRNNEYRAVRKWLMSLPPPAGVVGTAS